MHRKDCKIPTEWYTAIVIPIFMKTDSSNFSDFGGISLFVLGYKIHSKINARRFQKIIEYLLEESQNGFRQGHSFIGSIFTTDQINKKRHDCNEETCLSFVVMKRPLTMLKDHNYG
jgi:hypothetical protein